MGYPVAMVLRCVGVKRSTFYYQLRVAGREKVCRGGRLVPGWTRTLNGGRLGDDLECEGKNILQGPACNRSGSLDSLGRAG